MIGGHRYVKRKPSEHETRSRSRIASNRVGLRFTFDGILRQRRGAVRRAPHVTPARIGVVIVAVAFLIAEILRPTIPHAKQDAQTALVAATQVGSGGTRTTLEPQLLEDMPRIVGIPLGNIDDATASGAARCGICGPA